MPESLQEFAKYLQLGSRLDLKEYALTQVLALTGSPEALELVIASSQILYNLLTLLDDANASISKQSCLCLVNISAHEEGARNLVQLPISDLHKNRLQAPAAPVAATLVRFILAPECHFSDPACMALSNLSRCANLVHEVVSTIAATCPDVFTSLHSALTRLGHNQCGGTLDHLALVFSNLSQSGQVRRVLLNRQHSHMQRLVAFTEYSSSSIRRSGIVGTIRNCCFDPNDHDWLLGDDVDVLPRLLLPLAGAETFADDEADRLPIDLQFLGDDKRREEDASIRCMLLEALTQLCALRRHRQLMRDKNVYLVLRELHKWEADDKAKVACENLVDILIRSEDEIGEDNLKGVQVPDNVQVMLDKRLQT